MPAAVPEYTMTAARHACLAVLLALGLSGTNTLANEVTEPLCEYRTLVVDPHTGDIHFIAPEKIGSPDCSDTGAAKAELDPAWRDKLPRRVRWQQAREALSLCSSDQTTLGQRTQILPGQGCVFLLTAEACTILSAAAMSHAQLANAVRSCVP